MKNRGRQPVKKNKNNKSANLNHNILTAILSVNSLNKIITCIGRADKEKMIHQYAI